MCYIVAKWAIAHFFVSGGLLGGRDVVERMRALAAETAASFGLTLFDVEQKPRRGRTWFRIILDREDGPVTIGDCERVSKELSVRLDVEDFVPHAYDIEVSSPGVERPLRCARDFERFEGRQARLLIGQGGPDAGKALEGTLAGFADGSVLISTGEGLPQAVPLARLKEAHLTFRFPAGEPHGR